MLLSTTCPRASRESKAQPQKSLYPSTQSSTVERSWLKMPCTAPNCDFSRAYNRAFVKVSWSRMPSSSGGALVFSLYTALCLLPENYLETTFGCVEQTNIGLPEKLSPHEAKNPHKDGVRIKVVHPDTLKQEHVMILPAAGFPAALRFCPI